MEELTASEILDKCIASIDHGLWICGELSNNKGPNKHMGCAIGLVAIHSGHTTKNSMGVEEAMYLTDGKPPESAKQATKYLAMSTNFEYNENNISMHQDLVVEYNDGECTTPKEAKEWFVKARDKAASEGN